MKIFQFKSIKTTLLLWFIILSTIPVSILSYLSYTNTVKELNVAAESELRHTSKTHENFINNWFHYRKIDVTVWSKDSRTIKFMQGLNKDFKKNKLPLNKYIKSNGYKKLINKYEDDYISLHKSYDYIYDIFFFDVNKNLLFTVEKENDLATNFNKGIYKDTLFSATINKSLKYGKLYFSDLENYAPSANEPYGFLTIPIFDSNKKIIGIFAIQIKPNNVFSKVTSVNSEATGIAHFLVGKDHVLRSQIKKESKNDVLKKKLFIDVPTHLSSYISPNGKEVIGLSNNINILNIRWKLISEMDKSILFASTQKLLIKTLFFILATFITSLLIASYISKRLTDPLLELVRGSIKITNGDREQVLINSKNEIGILAKTFNKMVNNLSEKEAIVNDKIQESKTALHELKEQQLALDAHSIVAITDVKGTITYINKKFEEISGYTQEELIGNNHRILKSDEQDNAFWKEMYETVSRGYIWNAEIRNIAKDGHSYWVDTTIIPFLSEDGKPESYIAIRTDITEQKNNEIELLSAKEDAESALIAKSEFLASMSHEIRTPMNGVIGMLSLIKNSKLNDTQIHQLSLAESSAHSLLTLINDILDFSKIEAGKMDLEELEFNIRDELGEFAEAIGHRAQEKNIELILDVTEVKHKMIISDAGRLKQILNNLVGNAIKFTHDGEILIKVKLQEIDKTTGKLFFSVKDSGIGIPQNKIDSLFDSFTQVDSSTTRKYGGTGLGLSIVKHLSELMGGNISVESIEGEGSTFSFDINIKLLEDPGIVLPSVDIKGKRVLVVDDNAINREVLCGQLEYWGMQVFEAKDGEEAISLCRDELLKSNLPPFDIALIDMHMPEMDGANLGRKIKATPAYEDIKMVMMTSLGSRGDAKEFKEIGFNAFFPKPTTTKDLFHALNVLIEDSNALKISDNFITKDNLHAMQEQYSWPEDIRILLVEDNLTNQIVANGLLETFGLFADVANNGEEALTALKDALKTKPYTLVLMDCQMPILDGYGASEAIRIGKAGDENKDISIIAMTANAMKGDKEVCISSGMNDYVSKPINPDKLKETIKKWVFA